MDTHTHEYMIMHSSLAGWAGLVTSKGFWWHTELIVRRTHRPG
jgi:hypothetical protein